MIVELTRTVYIHVYDCVFDDCRGNQRIYIHIYDRIFDDFPAKNTEYTPDIYMGLANPSCECFIHASCMCTIPTDFCTVEVMAVCTVSNDGVSNPGKLTIFTEA